MTVSSAGGQQSQSDLFVSNTRGGGVNLYDMLLPPQAVILLAILMVMLPITVLAAESLLVPLLESVKSILIPEAEVMRTTLPMSFYIKLAAFFVLTFLGVFQLILRVRLTYYQVWAQSFSRPDALHVDYQPDSQQSMLAVLNWNIYRTLVIFVPPVVIGAIFVGTGFMELYMFNQFIDMPAVSLPAIIISFLFIILLLMLFTVFSILNSVWVMLITLFGDVMAITEPDLAAKTIYDRCRRVAFSSPYVYLLYPAYLLFIAGVVTEIILLSVNYNLNDLLHFNVNLPLILALEILTLALYLGLNYLKFFTYHHALHRYYQRLPAAFRERFVSPPPLVLPEPPLNSQES